MKILFKSDKKGFTLIEIMVSISIIAILMAISLVSAQGVRKSTRDGKRKADLEEIRSALEMCYSDDNKYPLTGAISSRVICPVSGRVYLDPTPKDPSSGDDYYYQRASDATYILCAHLETGGTTNICGMGANCGAGGVCNYKVTNP